MAEVRRSGGGALFLQLAGLPLMWLLVFTTTVLLPERVSIQRIGILSVWTIIVSPESVVPGIL